MKSLIDRLYQFISVQRLIDPGQTVYVAFSGGVDSLVLLHILRELSERMQFPLKAFHINHQLRGKSSDKQEQFARRAAEEMSIPLKIFRVDVMSVMKEEKISMEMAARKARLKIYQKILNENKNNIIATAHHYDDHIETIIINFLHGKGLAGLSGIPIRSGRIIHPFHDFRRSDIEEYARFYDLRFFEDESNRDTGILRNFIRHRLIPEVEQKFGLNLSTALGRMSIDLAEIEKLLISETDRAFRSCCIGENDQKIILEIPGIKRYLSTIRKYLIFYSLDKLCPEGYWRTHSEIERLNRLIDSGRTGAKSELACGVAVLVDRKKLIFRKIKEPWKEQTLIIPGRVENQSFILTSEEIRETDITPSSLPTEEIISGDRIGDRLQIRHWKKGDRFQPFGLKGTKKLSDLFIDAGINRFEKEEIPVVVNGEEIVWVAGLRLSEKYRITESTRRLVKLKYERKV